MDQQPRSVAEATDLNYWQPGFNGLHPANHYVVICGEEIVDHHHDLETLRRRALRDHRGRTFTIASGNGDLHLHHVPGPRVTTN